MPMLYAALAAVLGAWNALGQIPHDSSITIQARPVHHYVFFGQDRDTIARALSFLETQALEGAQITYTWGQLEPGDTVSQAGQVMTSPRAS